MQLNILASEGWSNLIGARIIWVSGFDRKEVSLRQTR